MRDKLGSTMSRSQAEMFLNQWIANYVIADDNASASAKSERPLRELASRSWKYRKTGALRAVAFLRPHFQLDELTVSLRLVADLPQPAGKIDRLPDLETSIPNRLRTRPNTKGCQHGG